MVEERPTALSAPGCYTSPTAARGWHYRAQLDMGERPDETSSSSSVSAISRTVRTTAIDSGYSIGSVLVVLQVFDWIAVLLLAMFVVAALTQRALRRAAILGGALGVLGLGMLVLGYLSGSVISIDNPTDRPVRVTVDGTVVDVPPGSFTDVRVMGPSVAIRTEANGQLLEEGTLSLDDHILATLFRITLGSGRFIYTVCGSNHFSLGHFSYG